MSLKIDAEKKDRHSNVAIKGVHILTLALVCLSRLTVFIDLGQLVIHTTKTK